MLLRALVLLVFLGGCGLRSAPVSETRSLGAIAPAPPTTDGSWWVHEDEPWIQELAREMLPDLAMPRILPRMLPEAQVRTLRRSPYLSNAYTREAAGDPHIYVNAFTDVYRKARAGDDEARRFLAATLDHEYRHLYGADEETAYRATIDRLQQLGASRGSIREAERGLEAARLQQQSDSKQQQLRKSILDEAERRRR